MIETSGNRRFVKNIEITDKTEEITKTNAIIEEINETASHIDEMKENSTL